MASLRTQYISEVALRATAEKLAREALEGTFKWTSEGNVPVVVNAALRDPNTTDSDFPRIVAKLAAQGSLCQNPEWSGPFSEFYRAYPEFNVDCNEAILIDGLIHEGKALTFMNLVHVSSLDKWRERLAVTAAGAAQQRAVAQREREEKLAEDYRKEMLDWFVNSGEDARLAKNGVPPSVWAQKVHQETQRIAGMDYAALTEEVTGRREVRRLRVLTGKEVRAEITASRQQPTTETAATPQPRYSQYEKIPEVYKTRSGQEIVMTRKSLIEVANHDAFAFREIVRRFGPDAVNDILAGRVSA